MENPIHSMSALFDQLGLDSSTASIDEFISQHRPLQQATLLHQASCWSPSQASFLQQIKQDDADWAGVADQLDTLLR
ncbi:DUF2789 domain-containing protein [uncultured Ferrimonas sp.]|uniref:DUF2789 domain-containing protein n=1 Tax=uncultured Ferrimonas sp. TaxID=432640 RepID=UPI00260B72BB|nr:DUF2789 domain-containing protein [uncultured Ferrimonas sp.]